MSFLNFLAGNFWDDPWGNPWYSSTAYYYSTVAPSAPPSYFSKMVSELHPWSSPRFKKKARSSLKKISPSLLVETYASSSSAAVTPAPSITGLSSSEVSTASVESSSMFMMHDSGKDSTVKLEWKSSPEPFHFGSFGSLDLHREEEDAPAGEDEVTGAQVTSIIKLEEDEENTVKFGTGDVASSARDVPSPRGTLEKEVTLTACEIFVAACRTSSGKPLSFVPIIVKSGNVFIVAKLCCISSAQFRARGRFSFQCVRHFECNHIHVAPWVHNLHGIHLASNAFVWYSDCVPHHREREVAEHLFDQMLERNVQQLFVIRVVQKPFDLMSEGASVFDGSLFAAKDGCSDGITSFTLTARMLYISKVADTLQGIQEQMLMLSRDPTAVKTVNVESQPIDLSPAPKSLEDIYKAHLLNGRASAGASVDSARENLAATFVNAFVNSGFGQDKLMIVTSDSSSSGSFGNWLFKNKEHEKTNAAASLGMILLWDVDSGLAQIDKYFHSNDNHIIAGALLGVGIVNRGIKNDCDPAMAILCDYTDKEDTSIRIGAIMGLKIAYAGSQNEQLRYKSAPFIYDNAPAVPKTAWVATFYMRIPAGTALDCVCGVVSVENQLAAVLGSQTIKQCSALRIFPRVTVAATHVLVFVEFLLLFQVGIG